MCMWRLSLSEPSGAEFRLPCVGGEVPVVPFEGTILSTTQRDDKTCVGSILLPSVSALCTLLAVLVRRHAAVV